MDKAEYREKLEQINELAEDGKFREAAEVADEIDWRHVKSVRTLSMIGEIYEANREYEQSLRVMKYAYRRSSSSKMVLYRLAELDIRLGNYDEAKKFINEFEQISPNDTSRYILKYKLLKAEKAPLDDQIEVLRSYRDTEYTERWAYELAKLYKKNDQKEKCIEECDDMILWFNEGKYVQKALELKMSLTELSDSQRAIYESNLKKLEAEEAARAEAAAEENAAEKAEEAVPQGVSKTDEVDDVREPDGLETAMKAVGEIDEEDEESKPKVSTGEAISRMETAAEFTMGDKRGAEAEEETPEEAVPEAAAEIEAALKAAPAEEAAADGEDAEEQDEEEAAEEAEEPVAEEEKEEKKAKPEKEEKFQHRLAHSLKAVFAGIRRSTAVEDDLEAEPEKQAEKPEEEPADDLSATLEEAAKRLESEKNGTAEEAEAEEPGKADAAVSEDADEVSKAAEEASEEAFDLDKLFAETGNAFASEVASGNYVLADTLEEDRDEAETRSWKKHLGDTVPEEIVIPGMDEIPSAAPEREEIPEEAAAETAPEETEEAPAEEAPAEETKEEDKNTLYARETDESLGLTREFHLRDDEIERALKARKEKERAEEEPFEGLTPEEAARETVMEAQGGISAPAAEEPESVPEEAPQEEDVVPEEEVPEEIPESELMNLKIAEPDGVSEEKGIIDQIMETPEYLRPVPVEGRPLTEAEKKALAYFASIPGIDYQITSAIADIHNNCGDRTSRSGNILMMGRMGSGKTRLAEALIRCVSIHLGLKAVREAKIVAEELNTKDPAAVIKKIAGGFLIIEAAGALNEDTVARLNQAMEFRTDDAIVILEDEKSDLMKMLEKHPGFAQKFTSSITVPVFTNDELVAFGKIYADDEGYKLDEMATLALYTMIGENQKDAEPVTVGMVRGMIDKAIDRSSRKFRFGKADKDEGKTVLHEKDFSF